MPGIAMSTLRLSQALGRFVPVLRENPQDGIAMAISAISSALSGMQRATERFDASATRIAQSGTGQGDVDVASEVVNILDAETAFKASALIARKADEMTKSTIDMLV